MKNRELTEGDQLRPRQMAQAMLLFPVPLGPMIMFRYGPRPNSTSSYVTKLCSLIRTMEPGMNLTTYLSKKGIEQHEKGITHPHHEEAS